MPTPNSHPRDIVRAGLWDNNVALVQLLGLCPLLAITTSVVNGLALGLATAAVLVISNALISLVRKALVPAVRIPLFVLVVASLVTCVDLLTHALRDDLHEALGLFIPLIATNCGLLAQAETVASRRPVVEATLSGLATGCGFLGVLVTLGALRELVGHGTLLSGLRLLTGSTGADATLHLPFDGMLIAVLPPGAFFGMGLLLALRNLLTREPAGTRAPAPEGAP